MRKTLLTLAVLALSAGAASAQEVYGYTISAGTGETVVPFSDGTVVYDGSDLTAKKELSMFMYGADGEISGTGVTKGYPIGFQLPFCGDKMTHFVVGAGGYVFFGTEENINVTWKANSKFAINAATGMKRVGFVGDGGAYVLPGGKISYKTEGTGDNAVLILQFENVGEGNGFSGYAAVNKQIRLTAGGDFQVNYTVLPDSPNNLKLRCGMGDLAEFFTTTYPTGGSWPDLEMVQKTVKYFEIADSKSEGSNYQITFAAPGGCVAPEAQPTDLQLVPTSVSVAGSFTASDTADSYLVVRRAPNGVTGTPEKGTTYEVGEQLGDAKVVYYGKGTTFNDTNVEGATEYVYEVYAANAEGKGGPAYQTENPLTGTAKTLCAAPSSVVLNSVTANSATYSVAVPNNEEVVILYTIYDDSTVSNEYNTGYFGNLTPDLKTGDVLPNPSGYNPCLQGAAPANAGVVGYAGPAADNIVISGLDASTMYYVNVYTRDADGNYTTEPVQTGVFTTIYAPFETDMTYWPWGFQEMFKTVLPYGWETISHPAGTNSPTYAFHMNYNRQSKQKQIVSIPATDDFDTENGLETYLILPDMQIVNRHEVVNFAFNLQYSRGRNDSGAYTDWADGDLLEVLVSEDGGASWTTLTTMTAADHSNSSIDADLNDYRGKTVKVKLNWKTFWSGMNLQFFLNSVTLKEADYPTVPEVTVSDVEAYTAKVSWVAAQPDYEVEYWEKADDTQKTTKQVYASKTYAIEGLTPLTTYVVQVRGLENGVYSDWSDPVEFTTLTWPDVAAPDNLKADLSAYVETKAVTLSWDATEEMTDYVIEYREGLGSEWTSLTSEEASVQVMDLAPNTAYVWRVRANCTHDRVTGWSSQSTFTTPQETGVQSVADGYAVTVANGKVSISGVYGMNVEVYGVDGTVVDRVAGAGEVYEVSLDNGIYVVRIGNKSILVKI